MTRPKIGDLAMACAHIKADLPTKSFHFYCGGGGAVRIAGDGPEIVERPLVVLCDACDRCGVTTGGYWSITIEPYHVASFVNLEAQ